MDLLFLLLAFVCLIVLVIGLVQPTMVIKWGPEEKKTRDNALKYYGIPLLIFCILFFIGNMDNPGAEKDSLENQRVTAEQPATVDEKVAAKLDKKIAALGDLDSVTLDESDDVQTVRNNYESLTANQKILVTKLSLLTEIEKKVGELQEAENQVEIKAQEAVQAQIKAQEAAEAQAAVEDQSKAEISQPSQNNQYTVYITKTGEKYHRDGCRYLRQSQIAILKSDAINQGYTPCSICNP